jgi:hypothetical protein
MGDSLVSRACREIGIALTGLFCSAPSASGFVSFGHPEYLHTDFDDDPRIDADVYLETDKAGTWIAVTSAPYVSRSTDNGVTWSAPVLIPPGGGAPQIWASEPQVVYDGAGTWLLAWAADVDGFGPGDYEVYLSRSTDGGANWSPGVAFASNAATDGGAYDNRPRLATDGAGNWMAVWHTNILPSTDDDILFTTSTDDGMTWAPVAAIDPFAPIENQNDNWANVATDGAGNWLVVYSNNPSITTGKVRAFRSNDFGATWTGPTQLNTSLGLVKPEIASSGPGKFVTTYTNLNTFISRTVNAGQNWTHIPVSGDLSGAQYFSRLATDGQGGWVVAWITDDDPEGTAGTDGDVAMSRSADDGVSWTSPTYLNLDANTDGLYHYDNRVFLETDGAGMWIAAWDRDNTSDDSDIDVLLARSDPLCPLQRRNDCITPNEPGKGTLSLKNGVEDPKDAFTLKLGKLGDTQKSDFGNPFLGSEFAVCHWDAQGDVDRLITQVRMFGGGLCDGVPCWKESATGFGYKDALAENGAIAKGSFKSGTGGKASIKLQGKGVRVGVPVMPFDVDSSMALQVMSLDTNVCWGATFSDTAKNAYEGYKAKSD